MRNWFFSDNYASRKGRSLFLCLYWSERSARSLTLPLSCMKQIHDGISSSAGYRSIFVDRFLLLRERARESSSHALCDRHDKCRRCWHDYFERTKRFSNTIAHLNRNRNRNRATCSIARRSLAQIFLPSLNLGSTSIEGKLEDSFRWSDVISGVLDECVGHESISRLRCEERKEQKKHVTGSLLRLARMKEKQRIPLDPNERTNAWSSSSSVLSVDFSLLPHIHPQPQTSVTLHRTDDSAFFGW